MKKIIATGLGALTLAGAATAEIYNPDQDEVIQLGSFQLAGGAFEIIQYMPDPDNTKEIVGITVEFFYDEPVSDASWASDLEFRLLGSADPEDSLFAVGGFTDDFPTDADWSFQGSQSDDPGFYSTTFWFKDDPIIKQDLWDFYIENDWNGDPNANVYDITVTLHKIPAPGAAALFGLAGVASARRRR
jgi:uncharacterized protein (TIGR03382 family)